MWEGKPARDKEYTQGPKCRRAALEEMEEFRLAGDKARLNVGEQETVQRKGVGH